MNCTRKDGIYFAITIRENQLIELLNYILIIISVTFTFSDTFCYRSLLWLMLEQQGEINMIVFLRLFIPPRVEKRSCMRRENSDQTDCKISVCNHSASCWTHVLQVKRIDRSYCN